MLAPEILATGGLVFAFEHATVAGKLILLLLAIGSIFSWSVMLTKLRVVRYAQSQNARFLAAFRQDRQPLRLFEKNARFTGSPNLVAMAPGVSGALITTVTALCVAIPAMFGYNFLVTSIRAAVVEMDNFAAELASEFEHKYVDHNVREVAFRR